MNFEYSKANWGFKRWFYLIYCLTTTKAEANLDKATQNPWKSTWENNASDLIDFIAIPDRENILVAIFTTDSRCFIYFL